MKKKAGFVLAVVVVLLFNNVKATIVLPRIIGSNMVLQCRQPVPIWGTASPGEAITVFFAKQEKHAVADTAGKWKVILAPMMPSADEQMMSISGNDNTIVLDNILIGEVWLCSGQSNMEYAMRKLIKTKAPADGKPYPKNEVETAHNNAIRIFLVNRKTLSKTSDTHLDWSVAEDSALRSFSAAGYFFSKELNRQLKVPIGIIESAVSGSRIEPWIAGNEFKEGDPGKFYYPMIAPLAPFSLKGFLWYQGESNCFLKDSTQYTGKMNTLIRDWRQAWGNNKLPFYYVQIAPFFYSKSKGQIVLDEESEAVFRESQALALKIPNTGMIVTTDLNDDLNDLHPVNKWMIGQRLALLALAKTYGKQVTASGPVYQSMIKKGNTIELSFTNIGKGLIAKDDKPLTWFSICGADGKYIKANAFIKDNKVVVSATGITDPVAVKFAFNEAAQANLYNRDGLPALAFRTAGALQWTAPVYK